jgi:hypothetical protein
MGYSFLRLCAGGFLFQPSSCCTKKTQTKTKTKTKTKTRGAAIKPPDWSCSKAWPATGNQQGGTDSATESASSTCSQPRPCAKRRPRRRYGALCKGSTCPNLRPAGGTVPRSTGKGTRCETMQSCPVHGEPIWRPVSAGGQRYVQHRGRTRLDRTEEQKRCGCMTVLGQPGRVVGDTKQRGGGQRRPTA